MLELLFWIGVLALSLFALIKGADWFTQGAEEVGFRLGMSPFLVGVSVVAIGTSLPELGSSIAAVLEGTSNMVVGTVVGSNIANILFVLGLSAIVGKGIQTKGTVRRSDVPLLGIATLALAVAILDLQVVLLEGIIFFALFIAYLIHISYLHKNTGFSSIEKRTPLFLVALLAGFALLALGADFLVQSVVELSLMLGVSTAVLSASIVAFGTSIPEVIVSVMAIMKGKNAIALGNIIGSCVFNILFVTSVASFFGVLAVGTDIIYLGLPVLFASTIALWILTRERNVTRMEGIGLFIGYVLFVSVLFF